MDKGQESGTIGMLAGGAGALVFALDRSVRASDLELHPPNMCGVIVAFSAL
nr:unnamed protein product [Callosobruchus analis]